MMKSPPLASNTLSYHESLRLLQALASQTSFPCTLDPDKHHIDVLSPDSEQSPGAEGLLGEASNSVPGLRAVRPDALLASGNKNLRKRPDLREDFSYIEGRPPAKARGCAVEHTRTRYAAESTGGPGGTDPWPPEAEEMPWPPEAEEMPWPPEVLFRVCLPLVFPRIGECVVREVYSPLPRPETLQTYVSRLSVEVPTSVLLLIQAGQAALGVVEEGELSHHKVIRKYMTRKKQGKAQVTYLQQKGKSRAGSRLRLKQSLDFFEEINEKLHEWDCVAEAEGIFYSCTPRLWGLLFESKSPPPFSRQDERLRKIPKDLPVPRLDTLERCLAILQRAEICSFGPCDGPRVWEELLSS